MTPLRIAFDMDGTLADFSAAYADVEDHLFGNVETASNRPAPEAREAEQDVKVGSPADAPADPELEEEEERRQNGRPSRPMDTRHRVWRAIEATPNFWTTLKPTEDAAVARLYQLTGDLNWEVFFITQRPSTAGATVQSQTHEWLVAQGFQTPSVIPLSGGRGKAASALRLDYLVDDTAQNCIDVVSDSSARAILLVDRDDPQAVSTAKRLGIGVAHSVHEALDVLVQATAARANPTLFEKLRKMVGWK